MQKTVSHKIKREFMRPFYQASRKLVDGFESKYRKKGDDNVTYNYDGMKLTGKNTGFITNEAFAKAYQKGMSSGYHRAMQNGVPVEIHIEWRMHIICWAARHAKSLPGDFVECGVNTGMFSLAICDYIDFNSLDKSFYLFDTFCGIPSEQRNDAEKEMLKADFPECYELAKKNFAPYPRAQLIKGLVPDTLKQVAIDRVCYLSLDMNIAYPEVAAIEFFWDKLVPGAVVVLDDYGFPGHVEQYREMNKFAQSVGTEIVTLPTGQGLLLK